MTERVRRMLTEAMQAKRPVLVNPTEDEIRQAAEQMRAEGRLICSGCRQPITEPSFQTRRIEFGPRLLIVAHLHPGCEAAFAGGDQAQEGPVG